MSEEIKLSLVVIDQCVQTRTSILPPETMDFDTWAKGFENLKTINSSAQWYIGDWMNFGEAAYGEKYAQALDATDYEVGTLQNFAWVCSKIKPQDRHEALSFTHHKIVATDKLTEEQRIEALDLAEKEGWSTSDLQRHVRELTHETSEVAAINYKEGMKEVRAVIDSVAVTAVPKKEDVQKLVGMHMDLKKLLDQYGIKEGS